MNSIFMQNKECNEIVTSLGLTYEDFYSESTVDFTPLCPDMIPCALMLYS